MQLQLLNSMHGMQMSCFSVDAHGGGLLLIDREEACRLGVNDIELCARWMAEKRGSLLQSNSSTS
jgi:hypothetical protein